MVHKVTMDTVKIITSSVSGMTNVSGPCPTRTAGLHARLGVNSHAQNSTSLLLPFLLSGVSRDLPLPVAWNYSKPSSKARSLMKTYSSSLYP